MPGEKSLLYQEYYNNSRNQFWTILSSIFNNEKQFLNYEEKLKILSKHKIGLWDVLDTCERKGSLDQNINSEIINDFDKLLTEFPNIKTLIFNGKESYNYFDKAILRKKEKKVLQLTSTSSMNSHKKLDEKIQIWKSALK